MRFFLVLMLLGCLFFSPWLWADSSGRFEHTVTVSLLLPYPGLQIISGNEADPWLTETQFMPWDYMQRQPQPVQKKLYIRSSLGAVTGRLLEPAQLGGDAGSLPLTVKLGSYELTTSPQTLLTASQAHEGVTLEVLISASPNEGDHYKPGRYRGVVNMLFELSAP